MKALEDKILKEGKVLSGDVLKVGSFLNQQMDSDFIMEMGKEIARLFEGNRITKILTVEASGIAIAVAAGYAMHVPAVFAKKHCSENVTGDLYKSLVHSYTHGNDNEIVIPKEYLSSFDKVLLVDDFLASGQAFNGLIDIVNQAGATLVGVTAAIEKGFQHGGDNLREQGIKVESLAIIDSMDNGKIVFRR